MSEDLTKTEREILEECAGMREPRPWGAHVGAALEFLEGKGLTRRGVITDAGRAYLAAPAPAPAIDIDAATGTADDQGNYHGSPAPAKRIDDGASGGKEE